MNIPEANTRKCLPELSLEHEQEEGKVIGTFTNNGHAPTFAIDKSYDTVTLEGGPLEGSSYELQQFHFHFGCESDKGSEHTVEGKAFSAEVSELVTVLTWSEESETAVSSLGLKRFSEPSCLYLYS